MKIAADCKLCKGSLQQCK